MKNKFGVTALIISFCPWILACFLPNIWFNFSWNPGLTTISWFEKNLFNYFTIIIYFISAIFSVIALNKKERKIYLILVFSQILIFGLWMLFMLYFISSWSRAVL